MHELLKGLKNMRKTNQELHDECSCRHDCANPKSVYRKAASFSSLEGACLCEGRPHPGLELPHLPQQPPIFRNLACYLQSKRNRGDIDTGTKLEEFRSAGRVVGPLGSVPTLMTTTRPCGAPSITATNNQQLG